MGDLVGMMKQYKDKAANSTDEISKLSELTLVKDNELANLESEIRSLHDFMSMVGEQQGEKIAVYKEEIDANQKVINRQDKLIVDHQSRNEMSQVAVAVSQDIVSQKASQKRNLEVKMKELADQREYFRGSITALDSNLVTMNHMGNFSHSYQNPRVTQQSQPTHYGSGSHPTSGFNSGSFVPN